MSTNSIFRRLFSAILLSLILIGLTTAGVASAHARLFRSNPEDGAVLAEAPQEVYLWFNEPVVVEFVSVELLDADAQPVGAIALRGDASDPTLVIASIPTLQTGVYSLTWKVLSNTDNHVTQGTLVFGIGQMAGVPVRPPAQTEASVPMVEVALRVVNYAALSVLIGSLAIAGLVLRRKGFDPSAHEAINAARRRIWMLSVGAAVFALAIGFGWLAWQSVAAERGPFDLLRTRFGVLWLARQCSLLILLIILAATHRERLWGQFVASLSVVALAGIEALNSHAAGLPNQTVLGVVVDTVHLLAAGAWVGSLFALLVGLLPLLRSHQEDWRAVALGGWRRFGAVATLSVGVLAATGLYNMARQVASIDAWVATLYGQVLTAKIGVFLMVGLAGLGNSMLLHPRLAAVIGSILRRPVGWRPFHPNRLPILLLTEAGLAVLVFVFTSVLTAAPPARGPEFEPPNLADKTPSSLSQTPGDLLVNLSIRPNKPGLNIISVGAFNTRRPPPAEILRVLVRLTYLEKDLGTQTLVLEPAEQDIYRLSSSAMSLPGAWRAQVVVRRKGMEDSVADFDWRIEPLALAVPPRPVMISNAPIASALTLLAVGLVVCTGLAAIGFRLVRDPSGGEQRRS